MLFHALKNPEITWRTRIYKLAWGGMAYEMPPLPSTKCTAAASHCSRSPMKFQLPDETPDGVHLIMEPDIDVVKNTTNHHHHQIMRLQSFQSIHPSSHKIAATDALTKLHNGGSTSTIMPKIKS